jgi:hypothetical protein
VYSYYSIIKDIKISAATIVSRSKKYGMPNCVDIDLTFEFRLDRSEGFSSLSEFDAPSIPDIGLFGSFLGFSGGSSSVKPGEDREPLAGSPGDPGRSIPMGALPSDDPAA